MIIAKILSVFGLILLVGSSFGGSIMGGSYGNFFPSQNEMYFPGYPAYLSQSFKVSESCSYY